MWLLLIIIAPVILIGILYLRNIIGSSGELLTCSYCGKSIHKNAKICPGCGSTFEEKEQSKK
jgi:predicted amidophosphoribosyltransferase